MKGHAVAPWREVSDPARLVESPRVSVLMLAYRHEQFIADSIEGVLSQAGGVAFELVIGEDASPDRTLEIVLDYQRRFPGVIRVITSDSNVGMEANTRRLLESARGEFLAYCEGDDYWCDTSKLATQVRMLDEDREAVMVHTDWARITAHGGGWRRRLLPAHARVPPRMLHGDIFRYFYQPALLRTCTVVVRREHALACEASPLRQRDYPFSDTVYWAYLTALGPVLYLPRVTAVYRESPNSALRSGVPARVRFLEAALDFDSEARRYFANRDDYPWNYRWELAAGLLLWSARALDWIAARRAIRILAGFGPAKTARALATALWSRGVGRRARAACP